MISFLTGEIRNIFPEKSIIEINVSGVTISGLNGGASESSNFSTSYTSSSIFGDVDSLFIPANSGLLTILDYNNISENQICFESSKEGIRSFPFIS